MKNLLLTGGLGYIGSKFVEKYSNSYNIFILDTGFFINEDNDYDRSKFIDIREITKHNLENIDFVVHMSELSNDPLGNLSKNLTNEINHYGTKTLLDLCKGTNISKFIYMSSASVYGLAETESHESSKTNPLTDYAKAKVLNENLIVNSNYDFEVIIFRNSTVFGYSKNLRLDLVINDLAYSGYRNRKIKLTSDGTPKRPFVHISDLCELIDKFLKEDRNFNKEIFNIGSSALNLSIKEVAEAIALFLNIEKVEFGDFDSDQRSYYLNFDKLHKTFVNYNIEYNLEKGLADLISNFERYYMTGNEVRLDKINKLVNEKKIDANLFWI